jgi:NADH:ubiquinone oxidoreductase subunit 5 (subunit L)/multisubunit Na+/H+ antiporter MnhA subunit
MATQLLEKISSGPFGGEGPFGGPYKVGEKLNLIVIFPLLLLALFSIFFGFVFSDLFVGMGSDFFQNSIFMHPKNISLIEAEFALSSVAAPSVASYEVGVNFVAAEGAYFNNYLNDVVVASQAQGAVGGHFYVVQHYNILIKQLPAILSLTGALSAFILYHYPLRSTLSAALRRSRSRTRILLLLLRSSSSRSKSSSFSSFPLLQQLLRILLLRSSRSILRSWSRSCREGFTPNDLYAPNVPPLGGGGGLFLINLTDNKLGRNIYAFLNGKYYFDVIYNHFIIISGLKLGYNISKEIDRGAIEFLGPYGLSNYFYNAGKNLAKLDTGVITTYSLYITIALISLLFIIFSPALAMASNNPANPQSLEEIRLFIIYITSALIVLSPLRSATGPSLF